MTESTKDFRRKIADMFIKSLTEKELEWKAQWNTSAPVNAVTGKNYKGVNYFNLMLRSCIENLPGQTVDNRWATFKQIQSQGWRVRRGAKGSKVEYQQPYDFDAKIPVSWQEYTENKAQNIGVINKYYVVFNGKDIEGIPPLSQESLRVEVNDEMIKKISLNMGVSIRNDGGERAFYRISDDTIHVPEVENFQSSYAYNSTVLHELSHATGAAHRLNRDIANPFGRGKYAYEELVAEISSSFMGQYVQAEVTKEHMANHKAYVQHWVRAVQKTPNILIKAIKDAEQAANLLELHAEIISREEHLKITNPIRGAGEKTEQNVQKPKETKSDYLIRMKETLRQNGYKPTRALMGHVKDLNTILGRENSLADIHEAFNNHSFADNKPADEKIRKIGKILQRQELVKAEAIPIR